MARSGSFHEKAIRTPSDVPDELFLALRKRFSERQLVELTAAISVAVRANSAGGK